MGKTLEGRQKLSDVLTIKIAQEQKPFKEGKLKNAEKLLKNREKCYKKTNEKIQ